MKLLVIFVIASASCATFATALEHREGSESHVATDTEARPAQVLMKGDEVHQAKRLGGRRQAAAALWTKLWATSWRSNVTQHQEPAEDLHAKRAQAKSWREMRHRMKDNIFSDGMLLWMLAFLVLFCYAMVWRAFFLAELPPKAPQTPIPRTAGQQIGPVKAFYASREVFPCISKLQLAKETPLACPLPPMLDVDWGIDVVGVHGRALLHARVRNRDLLEIVDRSSGHIAATMDRQLKIKGLGGRVPFGCLVKAEQGNGLPRFLLNEDASPQARIAVDVGPTGNHMSMFSVSGKRQQDGSGQLLATIERRFGHVVGNTRGTNGRKGEFLEMSIEPGVDGVLVAVCVLGVICFVQGPEPGSVEYKMQRESEPQAAAQVAANLTASRAYVPPGVHCAARGTR